MRSSGRGRGKAPKWTVAFHSAARSTCSATFGTATSGPAPRSIRSADTTKILFLPAEKDELTNGPGGAIEATRYLNEHGITAQTIVYPELTHFQAYSNTGFEVGSTLAAEWFLKYLGPSTPARTSSDEVRR